MAWALKFAANAAASTNYAVGKKINFGFQAEVRPIRMIRCDQKYYKNTDPEPLRNRTWFVPRLPISVAVNGTNNPPSGSQPSGTVYAELENLFVNQVAPTLYTNNNPNNNPML